MSDEDTKKVTPDEETEEIIEEKLEDATGGMQRPKVSFPDKLPFR